MRDKAIEKKGATWYDAGEYSCLKRPSQAVGCHMRNMAMLGFSHDRMREEARKNIQRRPELEQAYRLFFRPFGGLDD